MSQAKMLRNMAAAAFTTIAAVTSSASADITYTRGPFGMIPQISPMDVACEPQQFTPVQAAVCLSAIHREVAAIHRIAYRASISHDRALMDRDERRSSLRGSPPSMSALHALHYDSRDLDRQCDDLTPPPLFSDPITLTEAYGREPGLSRNYTRGIRDCLNASERSLERANAREASAQRIDDTRAAFSRFSRTSIVRPR